MMTYSIIYEKITDGSLPDDFFYAHIPALDLTTHGKGIEGARQAAIDLTTLWVAEKKANGENVPVENAPRWNYRGRQGIRTQKAGLIGTAKNNYF